MVSKGGALPYHLFPLTIQAPQKSHLVTQNPIPCPPHSLLKPRDSPVNGRHNIKNNSLSSVSRKNPLEPDSTRGGCGWTKFIPILSWRKKVGTTPHQDTFRPWHSGFNPWNSWKMHCSTRPPKTTNPKFPKWQPCFYAWKDFLKGGEACRSDQTEKLPGERAWAERGD